jgi:hypothetical protein
VTILTAVSAEGAVIAIRVVVTTSPCTACGPTCWHATESRPPRLETDRDGAQPDRHAVSTTLTAFAPVVATTGLSCFTILEANGGHEPVEAAGISVLVMLGAGLALAVAHASGKLWKMIKR